MMLERGFTRHVQPQKRESGQPNRLMQQSLWLGIKPVVPQLQGSRRDEGNLAAHFISHDLSSLPQRIISQMRVALCRQRVRVSEQSPNNR